ncbi:stage VI sporulation protein F [Halobacillus trueperi]|uniref:Stage VI sporulation protein F n=1 Tax=Halobacillus trueperi TaxID=156205 RepID=A0A3D8VL28_9BACI|nr:stage VI sporulation protein F [Halobacillus trueperi]RDY69861.1 stage VI sporulation protein F [Halobacillus trueperi]
MFGNIEKKSGVKMTEVFKLAQSLQGADFKDEKTVRKVVKRVCGMANRSISKEKEDMIVRAILQGKVPKDLQSLEKMVGKKRKNR